MHISEIVRFHVPGASVLQRYLDRSFNYSLWLHCANCLPTSGPLLEKQRVNTPYMEHVSWCLLMVCWCLLMFVDVCWCLLMFVASNCVYIYINLEEPLVGIDHRYQLDVHGPLGLLESFHTPFCCHALNGLGNLYVSMFLVVGSLYVCWWIHVSIHVSQVNMPHFSWLNSSGVVMKTSIWLIFVGQILDCPCRTTKKKLRWYSLLMVAFNHQPWFHPIKWVIYFILRFQTCLDENHDVVENSWVPPKFKKNLIFAVRPTHRASLHQI